MSGTGSELINTVKETFSQTEKGLRNLHPVLFIMGVIYVSNGGIADIAAPGKEEWSDYVTWFLLVPVLFGPTAYTAYRVYLELIDYLLVFFMRERYCPEDSNNTERFASLPYRLAMHTNAEYKGATFAELRNYYSYKFACCHNVMLSSILFLLLALWSGWECQWALGGVVAFVLAFMNYFVLIHRQRVSYMTFKITPLSMGG